MSRLPLLLYSALVLVSGCAFDTDGQLTTGASQAPLTQPPLGPFYDTYEGIRYPLILQPSCTRDRGFVYFQPVGDGPFPIAVYLPGTGGDHDTDTVHDYLRALAARGYLAAAVDYGQSSYVCSFGCCYKRKADCVFDAGHSDSLLNVLADRTDGDPNLGVVTWGHSQGGYLAVMSGDLNDVVVRALATGAAKPSGLYDACMTPEVRGLPSDALRFVIGEHDDVTSPKQADDLDGEAGLRRQLAELIEQPQCARHDVFSCFRDNGSGFYIVQDHEVVDGIADHQYFLVGAEGWWRSSDVIDPGYHESWRTWSVDATLDWLAGSCGNSVCDAAGT